MMAGPTAARVGTRRFGIAGGITVIAAAFAYLLYSGIGENLVYFLTPTELLAKGPSAYETPVRLGGQVAPGSVSWDAEALRLQFRITDGTRTLDVHARGAPPAMFRDGIGVVVEGRFTRADVFESTNLMVKHSNEYRPPHEGQEPQELYRSLLRDGEA
ncbi:MAG: cytochrome c maturation protein CcmE [Longimicrobiales bacterium]